MAAPTAPITPKGGINHIQVEHLTVGDEAFGVAWDGSLTVPTKNAIYDVIAWGTYTPTLTLEDNVTGANPLGHQYLRVGDMVTVIGALTMDPTAAGALTEIGMSLPIASNFGGFYQCSGTGMPSGAAGQTNGGAVLADTVNNRAKLSLWAVNVSNHAIYLHYTYRII